MKTTSTLLTIGAAAATLLIGAPAQAGTITIAPTDVYTSTELGGFNRIGDHVVNGSGLNALGQHTRAPGGTTWLSNFGGSIDTDPWIVFDLGTEHEITGFRVWNYNEGSPDLTNRGVNGLAVQYGSSVTPATGSGFTSTVAGVTNFAKANGQNTYTGEAVTGFTPFTTRYVKFDIGDTPGVGNFGGVTGDSYGLSEIRFFGTPSPLNLAPEITGVSASASSELPPIAPSFDRGIEHTVGGNGLSVLGEHTVTPDGFMWLSSGSGPFGGVDPDPEVVYDLGGLFEVDTLQIWNYNEGVPNLTNRGVNEVDILTSVDGVNYEFLSKEFLDQASGLAYDDFSEYVGIGKVAQFVKLDIVSNHGDANTFYGLSEVKFYGAPVPEPSTIAFWVFGACLGSVIYRRRRQA